jgi:hypothetical protein
MRDIVAWVATESARSHVDQPFQHPRGLWRAPIVPNGRGSRRQQDNYSCEMEGSVTPV